MLRLLLVVTTVFSCFSFAQASLLDSLKTAQLLTISPRDLTAVIKLNGELHLAKKGNLIYGQYRVNQVHPNYVLIESDEAIIRLVLPPTDSSDTPPPEIFYREANEDPVYQPNLNDQENGLKGVIQ